MARYVATVHSPLSPADAFLAMADIRQFPRWDPGVLVAVQVAGDGPGPGAAYDLTVKAGGTTVMRYDVVAYEDQRHVRLVAQTKHLVSEDEIRVTPGPGGVGSTVTYDAVLTLRGWRRAFDVVLGVAFRRIGDRAAAGLRRYLGAAA